MSEHPGTAVAHRMLRDSGYHHRAHGGAIHEDAAEDKKLIHEELGKARIKAKKGGHIKGMKAKEHPGRRKRGGMVDEDAQINERHLPGDDEPSDRKNGGRMHRADGGAMEKKKDHGKPGIGKVNIVIAKGDEKPGMAPPTATMPPPPAPHPMMPPPGGAPGGAPGGMPPPGAMPPRPPMPMAGGAPGMPPGGMPRPQGIRHGGHVRDRMGRFVGGGV